jgi:LysM repeat protein
MRAGAVIVVIGVGMWMMVLGGLAEDNPNGYTAVGQRDTTSLVSDPGPSEPVTEGDGVAEAEEEGTPEPTPTPTPAPEPDEPEQPSTADNVYVVERGDTMARIAQAHGVSLQALIAANPQISDPTRIEIGQEINIPD